MSNSVQADLRTSGSDLQPPKGRNTLHKSLLAALMAIATLGTAQGADELEITDRKLRNVRDAEYQVVRGRYQMSDGRTMDVVRRGHVVVVDLDGEDQTTLRASGPLDMHSANGRMSLRFEPRGTDDVHVVVTLYGSNRLTAQVLTSKPGG